jgi:hypothetical protein
MVSIAPTLEETAERPSSAYRRVSAAYLATASEVSAIWAAVAASSSMVEVIRSGGVLLGGGQQFPCRRADLLAAAADLTDQTAQVGEGVGERVRKQLEGLMLGVPVDEPHGQIPFGGPGENRGQLGDATLELVAFLVGPGPHRPDRARQGAVEPRDRREDRQHKDQPGDRGRIHRVGDVRRAEQASGEQQAEQRGLPLPQRRRGEEQARKVHDPHRTADATAGCHPAGDSDHDGQQDQGPVRRDAATDVGQR